MVPPQHCSTTAHVFFDFFSDDISFLKDVDVSPGMIVEYEALCSVGERFVCWCVWTSIYFSGCACGGIIVYWVRMWK